MARSHSRRTSRIFSVGLTCLVLSGAAVYIYKLHSRLNDSESRLAHAGGATQPSTAPDQTLAMLDATQSQALLAPDTPTSTSKTAPTEPGILVTSTPTGKSSAVMPSTPAPVRTASPTTAPSRTAGATSRPAARSAPTLATATLKATSPTVAHGAADSLFAAAKLKVDAGDLLGARAMVNDPLVSGSLSGRDADAARAFLMQINQKVIFSSQRYEDPYIEIVTVESSRTLPATARAHLVPWEAVCRANATSDRRIRAGQTLKVPKGPFNAVVTKSAFRMDLYLGGLPGESGALYVTSLPVGLGKADSTPTGQWLVSVGNKGKNLDWTNPRTNEHFAGADPLNPLGGFWIGIQGQQGNALGKTSYGIHGTIEPDSIGKQASMGCVRLRHDDIALVYDLLSEGKSRVWVMD